MHLPAKVSGNQVLETQYLSGALVHKLHPFP
jgi:hypothetical protein